MHSTATVDLNDAASIHDPARYFAEARKQGDIQWSDAQRGWVVLSHAEVEAAFRDNERLSSDRSASFRRASMGGPESFARAAELLSAWMNFRDPPAHTYLRDPVKRAFTPRAIGALESRVEEIVAEVLDGFGETVDLNRDFAQPIPAMVIAAILGVPADERAQFQEWSDGLGKLVFSTRGSGLPAEEIGAAADQFIGFFGGIIERERREPSGSLLTTIVHDTGSQFSDIELVGACTMLLFAGHETTTTLLSNALALLLERDDLLTDLRAHPEIDELAVEEFMRVVGPARSMVRKVAVDHERCGQQLQKGDTVYLAIASANHDPAVFADPARVDLRREPNLQLGFGWGPHFCLGASLARAEARIALRMLLDRFRMEPTGPIPAAHASELGFGRRPLRVRLEARGDQLYR